MINTDFFQGEQALFDLPCRDFQGGSLQLDRNQASSDFALGTWAKVAAPVPLPGALGLPACYRGCAPSANSTPIRQQR